MKKQQTSVGIDIGTSLIRVVVTEPSAPVDQLPRVLASVVVPSRGLRHGYVTNRDEAVIALRKAILRPKIILYDEPTTGLDPITSKEIVLLMKSIQTEYNTSSIIITHDVDCARVISDRMILLVDGINYAEGTFEELYVSEDPKVKAFFK